jgi:hypothetical protein
MGNRHYVYLSTRAEQKEEDSQKRTAIIGQPEWDNQNGTGRMNKAENDAKTGLQGKTAKIGMTGLDSQNKVTNMLQTKD